MSPTKPSYEFSDRAHFRYVGPDTVELLRDLGYYGSRGTWIVKKGFVSDGASIPQVFWSLLGHPLSGEYLESAILHDALARSGMYSPRDADDIMHEAMVAQGTPEDTINGVMLGLGISRLWRRQKALDPHLTEYLHATPAQYRGLEE